MDVALHNSRQKTVLFEFRETCSESGENETVCVPMETDISQSFLDSRHFRKGLFDGFPTRSTGVEQGPIDIKNKGVQFHHLRKDWRSIILSAS